MTAHIPNDPYELHLFDKVPGEWWDNAACKGHPQEWWFPPLGSDVQGATRKAKAICETCPSKVDCLDFALTPPVEVHGLWGGRTSQERRGMADRKRKTNSERTNQR